MITNRKMATLTEETESKMINALTDAYSLLQGSDLGNGITGQAVVMKIHDAINFFHLEKMKMEDECEHSGNLYNQPRQSDLTDKELREILRQCSSLLNPTDFEY